MRVNRSQEFVIGGYTLGGRHFDALIFGHWDGDRLMYAARTRSGFTPDVREQLHQRFRGLETPECPFANLGRGPDWGEDEKLPVAEARLGGAVRVCRVDAGQALAALEVCGIEGVETPLGRRAPTHRVVGPKMRALPEGQIRVKVSPRTGQSTTYRQFRSILYGARTECGVPNWRALSLPKNARVT